MIFPKRFLPLIACLVLAIATLLSCNKYPGYETTSNGLLKRLKKFGDCGVSLSHADFFLMNVTYHSLEKPDSGYSFLLHHNKLDAKHHDDESPLGLRLMEEM